MKIALFLPLTLLWLLGPSSLLYAEKDYAQYHTAIIRAERAIFVEKDSIKGLQIFDKTFAGYDFVFVDDCIEAFQLALVFKREDFAMRFIKKALDNGFELKLLDLLDQGCPCDFYNGRSKVTVSTQFMAKNRAHLEKYAAEHYDNYIQRIDKSAVAHLLKRHVREQLFKDTHKELQTTDGGQKAEYRRICDDNLRFIDSLAQAGVYVGEKNLGIYTGKQMEHLSVPFKPAEMGIYTSNQMEHLHLPFKTAENCLAVLLQFYRMPKGTDVPMIDEYEYFDKGYLYNMLFHNIHSYEHLTKYKDEAIKKGYLHPREYASLKFNGRDRTDVELYLQPVKNSPAAGAVAAVDARRKALLLPDYETDRRKHEFAHKHGLQLFFGMFNATR